MNTKTYAIGAAAAVVAMVGGLGAYVWVNGAGSGQSACVTGEIASGPGAIGGPFELISETGQTVTDKDVITKPTLIYFGYTFCPDVCPLDTVRNAEAADILREEGYDIQNVFISFDSARDTPESLADFTGNISEHMIGLTGSEEQIKAASQAYRTYYRVQNPGDEFTLIDHSTFTYLVMPETGYAGFFRRELDGEQLADRVQCFLDEA